MLLVKHLRVYQFILKRGHLLCFVFLVLNLVFEYVAWCDHLLLIGTQIKTVGEVVVFITKFL